MEKTTKEILTSVKINEELFNDFKINKVKYKFDLKSLVENAMHRYNNDAVFRKEIQNYKK